MKARRFIQHPLLVSLCGALLICAIVAGLTAAGALETAELQFYDWLVYGDELEVPPSEIVIVDFDDATMDGLNIFPIPRELLAQVIEKIAAGEANLIGLDVLLTERRDAAGDQKLVSALSAAGNVIIANNYGSLQLPAAEPLPMFREAALDVAFVNLPVDEDGRIRRIQMLMRSKEFTGVALPVALASNYTGKPLEAARPGHARIGATEIPFDDAGMNTALIRFWNPTASQLISVRQLMAKEFDLRIFKGKIVLIGQSSAKGKDLFLTPVNRLGAQPGSNVMLSGTEIHAAALATLLTGKTIKVLDRRALWLTNFVLVWLVLAAVLVVRPAYSILVLAAGLAGGYWGAQYLFSGLDIWMRFVSSAAGIVMAMPAGLGYRFIEERRMKALAEAEQRELMSLFGRYLSPDVAKEIWNRRSEIVLAGEERVATVLFSDIRNFTAQSAGRPSGEVLAWLNEYFTAMSEVIQRNGGYLNKFIGDGMLVLFGVPFSNGVENDACRAVQTAIEMIERVKELNAQLRADQPKIAIGVGIHTGPLTAGNVGARDRLEYSVIGETVNLASRLEALTKEYKTPIVLSPQAHDAVTGKYEMAALGEAAVRGFEGTIRLYGVRSSTHGEEQRGGDANKEKAER